MVQVCRHAQADHGLPARLKVASFCHVQVDSNLLEHPKVHPFFTLPRAEIFGLVNLLITLPD
jgi:hypothetical protein